MPKTTREVGLHPSMKIIYKDIEENGNLGSTTGPVRLAIHCLACFGHGL